MVINECTELTIPEGTVQKIEDANGNIIWGSQTTFPYRKLEYIHLNGAEYIQMDFVAGTNEYNYQCDFTVGDIPTGSTARILLGIYDNSLADALRRWYLIWRGPNGIRCSVGNSWSNYATDFSLTDKLKVSFNYSKNGSTPRGYWYLNNVTTSTSIGSAAPLNGTTTGDINTTQTLKLGCQISQNGTASNYWLGNIYNFQRRQGGSSGTLTHYCVPCQRKSDNVCGVYDTINNEFLPMVGTTITDAAAGPVLDEYWNLT